MCELLHTAKTLLRLGKLRCQRPQRLRQRLERTGIGRLANLLERGVERLARLRLGKLDGQSLKRLRQRLERTGRRPTSFCVLGGSPARSSRATISRRR